MTFAFLDSVQNRVIRLLHGLTLNSTGYPCFIVAFWLILYYLTNIWIISFPRQCFTLTDQLHEHVSVALHSYTVNCSILSSMCNESLRAVEFAASRCSPQDPNLQIFNPRVNQNFLFTPYQDLVYRCTSHPTAFLWFEKVIFCILVVKI